jgi:hypothetical protein
MLNNNAPVVVKIEDNSGNVMEYYTTTTTNIFADGSQQGGDTFFVNGVPLGYSEHIEDSSSSPNVVNVAQPSGSFDFIRGTLQVDAASATLNIYDQHAFNTGQTYTIDGHSVTRTGSAGTYAVHFGNISSVNLFGAQYYNGSPSTFNVNDTPAWATTSITTGLQTDVVNVRGTTGQLNVHGQRHLTANLGNNGRLLGINGNVIFDNPPSVTDITVDDHNDPTGQTFNIGGAWGWGSINLPSSAIVYYKFADTSSVTLRTGIGGNTVNVWATGVTTNVIGNGFQYLDHINVGYNGSLQYINADLNISNPSGWWVINVDDSKDTNGHSATLGQSSFSPSWGTLSGLSWGRINYAYGDTYGLSIETNSSSTVLVYTDGGIDTWVNGHPV